MTKFSLHIKLVIPFYAKIAFMHIFLVITLAESSRNDGVEAVTGSGTHHSSGCGICNN